MDETRPTSRPAPLAYRPLVPVVAAFAAGVLLREYARLPFAAVWAAAVASLAGFPLARAGRRPGMALLAVYLLVAAGGWLRLDFLAGAPAADALARHLTEEPSLVKVRGIVASEPQRAVLPSVPLAGEATWLAEEATEMRFELNVREVEAEGNWRAASGRLRVTCEGTPEDVRYGSQIVLIGFARRPSPARNPGQLDLATLSRRRGIDAALWVQVPRREADRTREGDESCLKVERQGCGSLWMALACAARTRLRHLSEITLGAGTRAKALLDATLLGDRMDLDEELDEAFKRSGTAHLLAVSGMNVAIVAWAAWTVASFFGLGLRASGAVVLGTTMLYAMMCGLSPSVLRATVMTAALVVSILFRRRLDLLQSTALAALAILVARPYDLFDAGFQLSFAAVAGIVCLSGDIAELLRPKPSVLERAAAAEYLSRFHRLRLWMRPWEVNAVAVSVSASLGVVPLLAYYFNLFSPVALLANLIAVPLYSFATILSIVHVGAAAVSGWLAVVPALLVRGTMAAITAVIEGAARLPMAWAYCATPKLGWIVGYYALALIFVGRRRLRLSGKSAAIAWMAGIVLCLVATGPTPRPKGLEMTALDVEHGLAVVLRYPDGSTVLYDCGTYGRKDIGRWVVAPALWSWGVRRIDLLVVSHADSDHVNGIPPLLERFRIGRVLHGPVLGQASAGAELLRMLDDRGIPHQAAWAGDRFELGRGNLLEVLNPTEWTLLHRRGDQNENSLVLRASHEGRSILLGGDLQRVGAAVLPHLPVDVHADVLVVPHHGCEMKYGDGFARAVRPTYAICSNRAEHLAPSTLTHFQDVGASVLATCWEGAVTVKIRNGEVVAESFRPRSRTPAGGVPAPQDARPGLGGPPLP